jgi:hypothetical protein
MTFESLKQLRQSLSDRPSGGETLQLLDSAIQIIEVLLVQIENLKQSRLSLEARLFSLLRFRRHSLEVTEGTGSFETTQIPRPSQDTTLCPICFGKVSRERAASRFLAYPQRGHAREYFHPECISTFFLPIRQASSFLGHRS